MKPFRHPALYLALAWVLFLASVAYAYPRLPEPVASHFDFRGQADGWMSRGAYVAFTLAIGFGLPLLLAGACAATRFLPKWMVRMPHKQYWLAPERRAQTARYLTRQSLWLAAAAALYVTGDNLLLVRANLQPTPHLSNPLVYGLLGLFMAGTVAWCWLVFWRFRVPEQRAV